MKLNPTLVIAGVPVLAVRELLRRGARGFGRTAVVRVLKVDERAAEKLVEELVKLGLIDVEQLGTPNYWVPTTKGNSLAAALALPPMKRATAEKVLGGVLERVRQVNANDEYLYFVTRVDVFGSYLSDAPTLNDVDLGIEVRPRQPDREAHAEACRLRTQREIAAGRRFDRYIDQLAWQEKKIWRFLKARSPRVSLHELDELAQLGADRRTLLRL